MNINQIITENLNILQSAGVDSSRFEIKMLVAHVLGVEPKELTLSMDLTPQQIEKLAVMIQQRLKHKPIDKIIGQKGFYKYDFKVNSDVLSPREDTEVLVEKTIQLLKNNQSPRILEFGVGSGCIILSVLSDVTQATGIGIDISAKALAVADRNVEMLKINRKRLTLLQASWFDADLEQKLEPFSPFDIIVSNPPYIPTEEMPLLSDEVKCYDPYIALDGGEDGLRDYKRICELSYNLLKDKGFLLLEAGDKVQFQKIKAFALSVGLTFDDILKDLSNRERCIILKK